MSGAQVEFSADLEHIVWFTCGSESGYQLLCRPDSTPQISWQTALEMIFPRFETRGQTIRYRGVLTAAGMRNPRPFVASAFEDPDRTDLHHRAIKHFMLVLDADRTMVPERWELQFLEQLRPAFEILYAASRHEPEVDVRLRATETQLQSARAVSATGAASAPLVDAGLVALPLKKKVHWPMRPMFWTLAILLLAAAYAAFLWKSRH